MAVLTFKQFNEGKIEELVATIQDHVDSHIEDYKKGKLGHDQFGERLEKAKARIAKLHNLSMDATSKHVNSYVDSHIKEDLAILPTIGMGLLGGAASVVGSKLMKKVLPKDKEEEKE